MKNSTAWITALCLLLAFLWIVGYTLLSYAARRHWECAGAVLAANPRLSPAHAEVWCYREGI